MKKKQKLNRLAALLCAAALLLSATPVSRATAPTLALGSAAVKAGESCTVAVTAAGLENLAALNFTVYYDADVFTLSSSTPAGMDVVTGNTDTAGQITYDGMSVNGVSGDVTLLTMTFQAAADAAAGSYPLTIAVGDAYDVDLTAQEISATGGVLTVAEDETVVRQVTFYANGSTSSVSGGEDYVITVYASDTGDLSAGNFVFTFDSDLFAYKELELLDAMYPGDSLYSVNAEREGQVVLSYASLETLQPHNYLLNLHLTAKTVTADTATVVEFELGDAYSVNNQPLSGDKRTLSVTVTPPEPEEPDYPDFRLDVPAQAATNEIVVVTAAIEGSSGLAAADFTIRYDVEKLECVSVTTYEDETGTDVDSLVVTNPNFGAGTVKFSFVNSNGISEDQTLVYIRFKVRQNLEQTILLTASGTDVVDAQYNPVVLEYVPAEFTTYVPEFEVTFMDHDGKQLGQTQTVPYLGSAAAPEVGGKDPDADVHYVFSGWSEPITAITGDLTVTAQYEAVNHTFGDGVSVGAVQHRLACSGCRVTKLADHQWNEQNVCADCGLDGISVSLSEDETLLTVHLNHLNLGEEENCLLDVSAAVPAVVVELEGAALSQLKEIPLILQTASAAVTLSGDAMSGIFAAAPGGAEIRVERFEKDGLVIYTTAVNDSFGEAITLESGSISLELSAVNACLAFALDDSEQRSLLPCSYEGGNAVIAMPETGMVAINPIDVTISQDGVQAAFGAAPSDYTVIVAGYGENEKMTGCAVNDDRQRSEFAFSGTGVNIVRIFILGDAYVPVIKQIELANETA